jgi:hypothetical protein
VALPQTVGQVAGATRVNRGRTPEAHADRRLTQTAHTARETTVTVGLVQSAT